MEYLIREVIITTLSFVGLALFWSQVQRCRVYEGLMRLVAMEGLANVVLPLVWHVPPLVATAPCDKDTAASS